MDERAGLPKLSLGGSDALSSDFVFWAGNWTWADEQVAFRVTGPFAYSIAGSNPTLGFDLLATVARTSAHQLTWQFDLDAHRSLSQVIGGGLEFRFDLDAFASELGEPQLLAGNRGWTWGTGRTRIEMRFDPALPAVYFERGAKSEVRAFFYRDEIPQGRQHYLVTLTVSDDVVLAPTASERFGKVDIDRWPRDILDPMKSPVDLSFLNAAERPAGRHGFLRASADQLVFEDGTPVRFWGTNLTSYALFGTSAENVRRQAQRLSRLGFNLIRLHHHDSEWVTPNIFGDQSSADTRNLSASALDKLDWWIKCLKDEGIYLWLDLEDGRRFKPADGIDDFGEIAHEKGGGELKGYSYVNRSIQRAMERFNDLYLSHRNRFTGLRYKDDPAIAAILITNENDLTNHFGNSLLPDKAVPAHTAIYMRLAREFAAKNSLPSEQVWRSWENGPSKLFLNDLEERFDADMIGDLHASGVKSPIATTSTWGANPLSSLPALTVGDLIDVHSYGGVGELERDPLHAANLVHWIAAAHVVAKPLSVTEWDVEAQGSLVPDRQDIPLYVAASAAMQGWNAVMFFAYSQEPFGEGQGTASVYQAYNDPALIASLPAAALLYRQGHVREAGTTYVFAPSVQTLFYQGESPANSVALRTAAERGRLLVALPKVAQLPWLKASPIPAAVKVIRDPRESEIAPNSSQVVSDSGELRRNWQEGIFTIDTPRTQAAMGWIGGKAIRLSDIEVDVTTRNSMVAVQSLDGDRVRLSRRLMISVAARSVPAAQKSLPFHSEPVEGRIFVRAPPGLDLTVRDGRSGRTRRVPVAYEGGRYAVTLDRSVRSSWLLLEHSAREH